MTDEYDTLPGAGETVEIETHHGTFVIDQQTFSALFDDYLKTVTEDQKLKDMTPEEIAALFFLCGMQAGRMTAPGVSCFPFL